MLAGALQRISSKLDPAHAKQMFLLVQVGLVAAVLIFVYWIGARRHDSNFRIREAQKPKGPGRGKTADALAEARMKRNEPLRLTGIRLEGEPHEILGISASASTAEIQKAYRDLMKLYHPDRVGRPGSREWTDAQKIAEAINTARNRMLAAQSHNPNRSGR